MLNNYCIEKIQIHIKVICDIIEECKNKNLKILVFGLGYDSRLWKSIGNTFFVENKKEWINSNKRMFFDQIIEYDYPNINVEKSFELSNEEITKYTIPKRLIELSPFDLIIIDGPQGYNSKTPGRLLPIYWTASKKISKPGTVVYIDDSNRPLESYLINKYLKNKDVLKFTERGGCSKFVI